MWKELYVLYFVFNFVILNGFIVIWSLIESMMSCTLVDGNNLEINKLALLGRLSITAKLDEFLIPKLGTRFFLYCYYYCFYWV